MYSRWMLRVYFKPLRSLAIGMVVLLQFQPSIGLADARSNDNPESKSNVIVDLTAPPGHLTDQQKREWENQQQKVWSEVLAQSVHQDRGDVYFRGGKYREAMQEYLQALEKSAIKPEAFMAREGLAWTYEALGDFSKAIVEIDYLIAHTPSKEVRQSEMEWKRAIEAASEGKYDLAVQYYQERLATAKDWEKKSHFIEQRLRLMEERARAAGRLPQANNP